MARRSKDTPQKAALREMMSVILEGTLDAEMEEPWRSEGIRRLVIKNFLVYASGSVSIQNPSGKANEIFLEAVSGYKRPWIN